MANLNKVLLIGNLTRDVEMRATQGGVQIAKMGMAINRKFTQNGQSRETTCFVDLTAFGRQAEVLAKYVSKGSPLFVEGRLEFSNWEDKEGNKRSKLEVIVENFQFLGGGAGAGGRGGEAGSRGSRGQASRQAGAEQDYGAEAGGDSGSNAGSDAGGEYGDIPF
jgi:single-strand DNA-binding protein